MDREFIRVINVYVKFTSHVSPDLQYNGQPLVGGEMFPRMLRGIVAGDAFKREETDLKFRRQKEEELTSHFREIYEKSRIGTSNAGGSRENQEKYSGKNAQILPLLTAPFSETFVFV